VQKVFSYDLKLSHNTSVTDRQGQTDGRQLVPIARPLLKYCGLKQTTVTWIEQFSLF